MGELGKLKGLGPKAERCLNEIGIKTRNDLEAVGPIQAFIKLREECSIKPSINFLYAMVGALNERHWADVAKTEKNKLLLELEGYQELMASLKEEKVETGI